MKMKSTTDRIFDIFNIAFMILIVFMMLYPLYFTVIASISNPDAVAAGNVFLVPTGFTLNAYRYVFQNKEIWSGYRNTLFYTVFGTLFGLFLTIPSAYVLSKKNLPGRSLMSWYFLFTMYFGGGLIPTYIIVRDMKLLNQPLTLIVLGSFSVYYMIVTRIFFETSIPNELYESARIDGASEFRMFFQIALPLSKAILAVMALFFAVGRWNDYFTALIYTTDKELAPLQLVLRRILVLNESALSEIATGEGGAISGEDLLDRVQRANMAQAMKYSLIFIASAPLLIAYPFVQKYFVKGVMIGSLKG